MRQCPFLATNLGEFCRIAADEFDSFANRLAAATDHIEFFLSQRAVHRAAADQSAFFVLKDDDFERMTRRHVVLGECLRDFDRAHRADVAVVVSAFRNAVDVRTEQHRFEAAVAAGATANDISGGVDRYVQLRRAHQAHHVFASLSIGFAVSDATDAALRVLAKLRQRMNVSMMRLPFTRS